MTANVSRLCAVPILKLAQTQIKSTMEHDLEIFDKDGKALHIASVISRYLLEVSEKHNTPIERLMCGVLQNDFYVWDYDSGRSYDSQFKVVGIFPL